MARITVEDCIEKIKNQYELVILAKERAVQLGRGAAPAVDPENDKKPVIALREIGEAKIIPNDLEDSIVGKLRQVADYQEEEEIDDLADDTFRQMYQGGLSKSEMEKTATRKFTSRSPRIEVKPIKNEEATNDFSVLDNDDNNSEQNKFFENKIDENEESNVLEIISDNLETEINEFSKKVDEDIQISDGESPTSDTSEEDKNKNS